jgi:cysteinyl-tRNA synthetase
LDLKLFNTLTRRKEIFKPINPENVRMYVCGPTVYDYAHIGNARPIIVFDVLYRVLRHVYGKTHVTYVRNITDVDDKINERAAQEGVSIGEITARTTRQFHRDIAALGVLPPSKEPRATDHIAGMIAMIETLIERGHAYVAGGHVCFSVSSDQSYGCLSNRSPDEMRAGARVDVASYKKDPMDFVLWKPSTPELPGWDSPWGRGRPGWHIECSVMSEKYLGETFDIHGGGADLIFPHHENEIAQSTCAHGNTVMANYFVHNGYLQVEGEKMSKSLGNFVTIHDLLNDWPGEVLRLNMLRTHYRQPIDWTLQGLKECTTILDRWHEISEETQVGIGQDYPQDSEFVNALSNDLNTPGAIARIHQLAKQARKDGTAYSEQAKSWIVAIELLGFNPNSWLSGIKEAELVKASDDKFGVKVETLINARNTARAAKNWAEADRIRDELDAMGVILKDGPEGTSWEVKR